MNNRKKRSPLARATATKGQMKPAADPSTANSSTKEPQQPPPVNCVDALKAKAAAEPAQPSASHKALPAAKEPSGATEVVADTLAASWAVRINRAVEKTVRSCVEIGRELIAAKDALKHGQWEKMFKTKQVNLDRTLAQRLMKIAKQAALAKTANLPHLPPSPSALVALSKLPPQVVEAGIAEGLT
jgi:Protein of unknown function (DUF3102)